MHLGFLLHVFLYFIIIQTRLRNCPPQQEQEPVNQGQRDGDGDVVGDGDVAGVCSWSQDSFRDGVTVGAAGVAGETPRAGAGLH